MLLHAAHLHAARRGEREAFGVQRLHQPSDGRGDVGVLPPRLAVLDAREVAERDGEVAFAD